MPDFNALDALAARQQFALLGGQPVRLVKGAADPIDTTALVDRDIDVPVDNGLAVTTGTVLSLLQADVGRVARGDSLTLNPDDPDAAEAFQVADVLGDDGVIVRVYVRG